MTRHLSTKQLADLCRRFAVSLHAGVDLRTVWRREAEGAAGRIGLALRSIADHLERGESLRDSLEDAGDAFPSVFRGLVQIGEQTGRLPEAFAELAKHYERRLVMRRAFLSALWWPAIELTIAAGIVGLLIWIQGVLGDRAGTKLDFLGLGLRGVGGLAIYLAVLTTLIAGCWTLGRAIARRARWTAPLVNLAYRVPLLGRLLETLALGRLAWSLHAGLSAALDVRRAIALGLQTVSVRYARTAGAIDAAIAAGDGVYEAFYETRAFPERFLEAIALGEETGDLAEPLGRFATRCHVDAETAMQRLAGVVGAIVWALVATVVVAILFRLFTGYIDMIRDAARP